MFKRIHTGDKVKGLVVAVNNTEAIVDIGTKHTGYVTLYDLTNDTSKKPADIVRVGDELDLVVITVNDAEGTAALKLATIDIQREELRQERIVNDVLSIVHVMIQ